MRKRLMRVGVGDTLTDLNSFISDITTSVRNVRSAVNPVLAITADPAFPQIVGLVQELHDLEQPSDPTAPEVPGVGLSRLVGPLQGYVAYRRNPILVGAAVLAVVVGIPFALGYMFGNNKR